MRLFIFSLFIVSIFSAQAFAQTPCKPTPQLAVQNYPGAANVPSGNNLLLPAGKSVPSPGQQLVLIGKLFDNRCIPILNATVELWQVDPYGKWILAGGSELVNSNPVFAGAGRSYTDNGGNFFFTTAFPAALKDRAPHLNLKVKAQGMEEFRTQVFFGGDARNDSDNALKKLNPEQRGQLMLEMGQMGNAGYSGMITIVLPGKAPFRSY